MKKFLLAVTICLATTTFVIGQTIVYDTIRYAKEYYQKRILLFNSEKVVKGKTVFLGNSITEFGDWQPLLHDSTVIVYCIPEIFICNESLF